MATNPAKTTKALAEANQSLNDAVRKAEMHQKTTLHQLYMSQEKLEVCISPMYKPYFGEHLEVSINGIYVAVPCDGKVYKLPKSFASEVHSRIMNVDESQKIANNLANVQENKELTPGELQLF